MPWLPAISDISRLRCASYASDLGKGIAPASVAQLLYFMRVRPICRQIGPLVCFLVPRRFLVGRASPDLDHNRWLPSVPETSTGSSPANTAS